MKQKRLMIRFFLFCMMMFLSFLKQKTPSDIVEGTEKHTIFILTLIKKKKSIRVFMILVDFLLGEI